MDSWFPISSGCSSWPRFSQKELIELVFVYSLYIVYHSLRTSFVFGIKRCSRLIILFFFFSSFYTCTCGMWKVPSELWLPAYSTATAMPNPSHVCVPHHSSQQCWILNPVSKTRDQTHILTDTMSGSSPHEPQWELLQAHLAFWFLSVCFKTGCDAIPLFINNEIIKYIS